jgi:hypothetical protein
MPGVEVISRRRQKKYEEEMDEANWSDIGDILEQKTEQNN